MKKFIVKGNGFEWKDRRAKNDANPGWLQNTISKVIKKALWEEYEIQDYGIKEIFWNITREDDDLIFFAWSADISKYIYEENYTSQGRAEGSGQVNILTGDGYAQIDHTRNNAWQGRPVNNEVLTDRALTAIAHGVVPRGLRITDLNGHLYEDTNEVVFVVSFMDEYKTNESWTVKKASYDTLDYDYVVLEEFKNLSEDEAWDIFQSRDF